MSIADIEAALPGVEVSGDAAVVLRFLGPGHDAGDDGLDARPGVARVRVRHSRATRAGRGRSSGSMGDGCTRLTVTAWNDPSTQTTPFVDVTLDIQR